MKFSHFYTVEEPVLNPDGSNLVDGDGAVYQKPSDNPLFVENGKPKWFVSPMEIHQAIIDASNADKKFTPPGVFRIIENFLYSKD